MRRVGGRWRKSYAHLDNDLQSHPQFNYRSQNVLITYSLETSRAGICMKRKPPKRSSSSNRRPASTARCFSCLLADDAQVVGLQPSFTRITRTLFGQFLHTAQLFCTSIRQKQCTCMDVSYTTADRSASSTPKA